MCKSKGQSQAGVRELTNSVLQLVRRKNLMIGYSHISPRNDRWLVKTLLFFLRISQVLPPSLVVCVKDGVKSSADACFRLEVVRSPEKNPDHTVRIATDCDAEQSLAREQRCTVISM